MKTIYVPELHMTGTAKPTHFFSSITGINQLEKPSDSRLKEPLNISTWAASVHSSNYIAVKSKLHPETFYLKSSLSETHRMHRKLQHRIAFNHENMRTWSPQDGNRRLSRCLMHKAESLTAFIWAQTLSLLTLATKQRFHCPASLKKMIILPRYRSVRYKNSA